MKPKIKIEVRTHKAFEEFEEARGKGLRISHIIGRHQFIYKRNGNEISLIEIDVMDSGWLWEIQCVKGNLFGSTKRFNSKQEADDKIIALLTPEEQL